MKKKKLTDKEIVEALDICYNDIHCSVDCPYFNLNGGNFCQDKELYKDLKRIVLEHSEQKAENERLTELQSRGGYRVAELSIENAELQKQVDELKDKFEKEYAGFMVRQAKAIHDAYERGVEETKYEYEREIVEKRKVLIDLDQYTEDIETLRKETWHDAYSKGKQQTVKDTAKEICLKIIKGQPQPIKEKWVEWFKKEYSVEVE